MKFYRNEQGKLVPAHEEDAGYFLLSLDEYRARNRNLSRIERERANAERELRPKKEHTGYVVLLSKQTNTDCTPMEGVCRNSLDQEWETRIQTPWDTEYLEEEARENTLRELFFGRTPLLVNLGIYPNGYGMDAIDYYDHGRVTGYRMSIDYRTRYWEITIKHTRPLGIVPEEMLPPKKKKKGK